MGVVLKHGLLRRDCKAVSVSRHDCCEVIKDFLNESLAYMIEKKLIHSPLHDLI
jgi:hypothetical protein